MLESGWPQRSRQFMAPMRLARTPISGLPVFRQTMQEGRCETVTGPHRIAYYFNSACFGFAVLSPAQNCTSPRTKRHTRCLPAKYDSARSTKRFDAGKWQSGELRSRLHFRFIELDDSAEEYRVPKHNHFGAHAVKRARSSAES